jgi:hypothetical protein
MIIPLVDALLEVENTYRDQPREFPEMPAGWLSNLNDALVVNDHRSLFRLGKVLATAHSQYPADFERKPWLAVLRQSLREEAKNQ